MSNRVKQKNKFPGFHCRSQRARRVWLRQCKCDDNIVEQGHLSAYKRFWSARATVRFRERGEHFTYLHQSHQERYAGAKSVHETFSSRHDSVEEYFNISSLKIFYTSQRDISLATTANRRGNRKREIFH
jgi:hypothetical protein